VFVCAAVMDAGWSAPTPLDDTQLGDFAGNLAAIAALVADRGLTFALHPHAGTLVESAADVERLLATTDVGWCLDTGHLLIGGGDPAAFVRDHPDREVLAQLDAHGYERWLVLEQDAAITGEEPPVGSGPALDVQASIEFLANTAPRRERVVR
jgi:inosose dehydratase